MSLGAFDLTPKKDSDSVAIQKGIKDKAVTVIRDDGKEVLISTDMLAVHLERGFKLKTIKEAVKKVVKKAAKKK